MRSFVPTAALLLMLGTAANAADFGRPPVKAPLQPMVVDTWTGFYLGLNAGGGWAVGSSDFSAGGAQFASVDNHLSGWTGGGQFGLNWQLGIGVIGFEADFQAADVTGSLTAPCIPGICVLTTADYSQKVSWFGTVRGRVGLASVDWLLYLTGGYAYARLETDAVASAGAVTAAHTQDEIRNGWTAGGGIEVLLSQNWTAKIEYLYLDFGEVTSTWVLTGLPSVTDVARLRMNVVRAGVNFKF
jgi:outer membrane immunogenic protein